MKSGGKGKGTVARVTTRRVSRRTVLEMTSPDRSAALRDIYVRAFLGALQRRDEVSVPLLDGPC